VRATLALLIFNLFIFLFDQTGHHLLVPTKL